MHHFMHVPSLAIHIVIVVCVVCRTFYLGLLTPAFVACSTNAGEGLVKLNSCNDIPGRVEE